LRGIRIRLSKEDAASYQAARDKDPYFFTLCSDYSMLGICFREKRELELALVDLYKEEQAVVSRQGKSRKG